MTPKCRKFTLRLVPDYSTGFDPDFNNSHLKPKSEDLEGSEGQIPTGTPVYPRLENLSFHTYT